jgi:hypothetical protein
VVEDCVDEDGKTMIASVLTEVTVTVAALEEVEPATDDESDAWEEHRTDRERRTSKEANAIIQTSVKSRLENNSMRSGGESQCRSCGWDETENRIDLRVLPPRNG